MRFVSESHRYFADHGEELMSVTRILELAGYIDKRFFRPEHASRGRRVHEAIEIADLYGQVVDGGWRDELVRLGNDDDEIGGFLDAYHTFRSDTDYEPLDIELMVESKEPYPYAGTLDRTAMLSGRRVLLDVKTGSPARWHPIQCAAYALALGEPEIVTGCLYLADTGRYRLELHAQEVMEDAIRKWNEALKSVNGGRT